MGELIPACLAIAGADSSAGAGVQADLAAFHAFGIKGCSAVTALTAQNPDEITSVFVPPLAQLEAEIRAVFAYYDVAAVKCGMLVDAGRVRLVAALLRELHDGRPLVVDPVLVASSGRELLHPEARETLCRTLLPAATLITPNLPEANLLLGRDIDDPVDAAAELQRRFGAAILLKGGHGEGGELRDVLCVDGEIHLFTHPRRSWDRERAHGTGCRLAAAVAAGLGRGRTLERAAADAVAWLQNPDATPSAPAE